MNSCRKFTRISIFLLVFLPVCCCNVLTIAGKQVTVPKVQAQDVQPAEINPKEENPPAFQTSVALPDRKTIGCVLPLSGKYSDYGSNSLDAILLASGMFDENNKATWKIVTEDSRGIREGASTAVARIATAENVIAIIAVAGTAEAAGIAQEADKWKVPVILITPKEGVTKTHNYVFQHFLTPTQQIKALTKYALHDLNCAIFSILYPKDDYGVEMMNIFRAEVEGMGGKVEQIISYSKTHTDFTEEINKVIGNGIGTAVKSPADKRENKARISIDFEALFIPDSSPRVKMIASQLAYYDVKGIPLLGTSLWNSPELLRKGGEYLEGAVFADSFFVNGFYLETNDFVDIFYAAYGREPGNIEALSYDTAGIIFRVLSDKEIQTREQFIAALEKMENYKGATGNISFAGDKTAQKTAFILKIKDGKMEQVK